MKRVWIAEPDGFTREARELLESRCEVIAERLSDRRDYAKALDEADVLWVRLSRRLDRDLISNAKRCRLIATATTGLDHVDLEACDEHGVRVVSLRGETEFLREVRATAELTVGLALALLRHIPRAASSVLAGTWDRDPFRGHELYGKTVGIVGVGRLGSIVADTFRAFGAKVVGYDIRAADTAEIPRAPSLAALYAMSDIVTLHVGYDATTHHLVDPREFREGTWLINTSRGGVVDEEGLLAALDRGILRGAALDVLQGEPHVDATHRVVARAARDPRLLVVPHIGGNTFESFVKTERFVAGKILEALA